MQGNGLRCQTVPTWVSDEFCALATKAVLPEHPLPVTDSFESRRKMVP